MLSARIYCTKLIDVSAVPTDISPLLSFALSQSIKIFERINEFIFNRNIQIKKSKMCMKNGTTHTHTHTNTRTTSDKSLWYILFLYYHRYLKCIRSLKWKSLIITWYIRNRGNWIIGLVFPTHCRHLLSQIISRVEIFTIVARSTRDQIHINLF